jgi:hypothetical protein
MGQVTKPMQGSVNLVNLGLLEFRLARGVGAGHTYSGVMDLLEPLPFWMP